MHACGGTCAVKRYVRECLPLGEERASCVVVANGGDEQGGGAREAGEAFANVAPHSARCLCDGAWHGAASAHVSRGAGLGLDVEDHAADDHWWGRLPSCHMLCCCEEWQSCRSG